MTAPALPPKPLPSPSPVSRPFWEAARERRLSLQRCLPCRKYVFYPRTLCPHCGSGELEWSDVSGRGTVYSYTVARRAPAPAFEADVPYVIAIVELEEGPRMTTNIAGCSPDEVRIGMAVEAVFEDVNEEVTLVKFRPVN